MTAHHRTLVLAFALALALAGGVAWLGREATPSAGEARARTASRARAGARRAPAVDRAERTDPVDPRVAGQPSDLLAARLREPTVLTGTIVEASGATPEREGASCRFGIDRTDDPTRCRVVLQCGATSLHGDPIVHETPCALGDDGALRSLSDSGTTRNDRDPSLSFDAAEQTLEVRDDTMGAYGEYRVVVHFDSAR